MSQGKQLAFHRVSLLVFLSALLQVLSQPIVWESHGAPITLDETGWSGLLVFIAYAPLFFTIRRVAVKQGLYAVLCTQILAHIGIEYWLIIAMNVFGGIPIPIALVLLALLGMVLGLISVAFVYMGHRIAQILNVPVWLILPFSFFAGELARNYGPFGGYPWGHGGMAFATLPCLRLGAGVVGAYGLLLIALYASSACAEIIERFGSQRVKGPFVMLLTLSTVLAIIIIFQRQWVVKEKKSSSQTLRVALLQGNIEQGIKNTGVQSGRFVLQRFQKLQRDGFTEDPELIVWPEAALPYAISDSTDFRRFDLFDGSKSQVDILLGGIRQVGAVQLGSQQVQARTNSLIHLDGTGRRLGAVDKSHLVPFGEFTPWPFGYIVGALVPGTVAFGQPGAVLTLKDHKAPKKIGATICYEGLFPEISRTLTEQGANLLVNATNDAWYGISSAARQHFLFYVMRSIENGRSVVRVGNTGISGLIDIDGTVVEESSLFQTQTVMVEAPLYDGRTVYGRIGFLFDSVPMWCVLFMFCGTYLKEIKWSLLSNTDKVSAVCLSVMALIACGMPIFREQPLLDDGDASIAQLTFVFGVVPHLRYLTATKPHRILKTLHYILVLPLLLLFCVESVRDHNMLNLLQGSCAAVIVFFAVLTSRLKQP